MSYKKQFSKTLLMELQPVAGTMHLAAALDSEVYYSTYGHSKRGKCLYSLIS
jgi:hypothetical protein